MKSKVVSASRAPIWLSKGWKFFRLDPVKWSIQGIICLALAVVLHWVPILGALVFALISPALLGGLMYSAWRAYKFKSFEIPHLFYPLTAEDKRIDILILGGLLIVIYMVLYILGSSLIGSYLETAESSGWIVAILTPSAGMLLSLFAVVSIGLVVFMIMAYAIPLVVFTDTAALSAIRGAITAILKNFLPALLFAALVFGLSIAASLPFGLGLIVLLPVVGSALLVAFTETFTAEH